MALLILPVDFNRTWEPRPTHIAPTEHFIAQHRAQYAPVLVVPSDAILGMFDLREEVLMDRIDRLLPRSRLLAEEVVQL